MILKHFLIGVTAGGALVGGLVFWHPFRKSTPIDNQITFTDYQFSDNKLSTDGWIQISGSLNNPKLSEKDEDQANNNTLTIQCTQRNLKCNVARIEQIGNNQVNEISIDEFSISSWTQNKVIATDYEGDDSTCVKNEIVIERASQKSFYISTPIHTSRPNCINAETKINKFTIENSKVWRYLKKVT